MKDRGAWHSADTVGGWRNHYLRTKRWKLRAVGACRVVDDHHSESASDGPDFFLAYCVWAHSLLEWSKKDGETAEPKIRKELYLLDTWDLCRSVANRTRHFDQTQKPVPTDKLWRLARSSGGFLDQVKQQSSYEWLIWYGGKRMPASQILGEIDAMWDRLLAKHGLDPLQPPEELGEVTGKDPNA